MYILLVNRTKTLERYQKTKPFIVAKSGSNPGTEGKAPVTCQSYFTRLLELKGWVVVIQVWFFLSGTGTFRISGKATNVWCICHAVSVRVCLLDMGMSLLKCISAPTALRLRENWIMLECNALHSQISSVSQANLVHEGG